MGRDGVAPLTAPAAGYRLLLDIQGTQSRDYADRGVARYVAELARALVAHPGVVTGLLLNPTMPFPGHLAPDLSCSPLLRWNTATEVRRLLNHTPPAAYVVLSPIELGPGVDSVVPAHVIRTGMPLVVLLYDLIPLLDPDVYLVSPQRRERYRVRVELLRQADVVLALSATVREDAVRLLGLRADRVVVVGAGTTDFFSPTPPGDAPLARVRAAVPNLRLEHVLCVGGADPRKNVEALIRAWGEVGSGLRSWLQLVVVCRTDPATARSWTEIAAAAGLASQDMVLTGQVTDDVLRDLYRTARLCVFPSGAEGFGLPVAEAAACGCPVLATDRGSVAEVLDDPRAAVDPTDIPAFARALSDALENPARLGMLRDLARRRAPVWTWREVARRSLEGVRLLGLPVQSPPPRLRIALCGRASAASTPSGVEPSFVAVAAALSRGCDVDVFHVERGIDDALPSALPPTARILPASALVRGSAAATYDAMVYVSTGHASEAPLLTASRWWPGVVWLRDLDQSALVAAEAATSEPATPGAPWRGGPPPRVPLAEAIAEMEAPRSPAGIVAAPLNHSGRPRWTTAWSQGARALVVGEGASARGLRIDGGPLPPLRPTVEIRRGADAMVIADALAELVGTLAADPRRVTT